ncbi:spore coat protein [Clostridium tetani]|uniref:Spore coat protein n=1 Tax=Clostridium tetani TaxID=1513 RepID=A0A4Q0VBD8_CLOTA|nr:CotS family spore coat protein [Clostridium tetani]RXI48653.1 CotS family spore coat protein [Clostridium tetani]BDR65872.1 spore coat protein [Clostridium tetani]BDR79855.1 spore coat protein [Clostridium tetani]BDR88302.1 spore coat protein [Clostridium tetani]
MENRYIKKLVEDKYNIKAIHVEKIKNVYKIKSNRENFCLKLLKYRSQETLFITSAINHLYNNGFKNTPKIIQTVDKKDCISIGDYYGYLTPWMETRHCNYEDPKDVQLAAFTLGQLHKNSINFSWNKYIKSRYRMGRWIQNFNSKKSDISFFKNEIDKKDKPSYFDNLFRKVIDEELRRIDKSIYNLERSDYLNKIKSEKKKNPFCHHDYANHNVLIDKNDSVYIIDFDYCILDTHLHDLCSLIIRVMKNGKWNIENAKKIMDSYSLNYSINKKDIKIMAAFIEFPQDFWQVGLQYYAEKQPWKEKVFINKIKRIVDDREAKQEFVEEFRYINYGSGGCYD